MELLPLAIESVRLAFRTGLTATMVRDELEQGESSETWAVQSSRALGLGEDNLLDTIHKEEVSSSQPALVEVTWLTIFFRVYPNAKEVTLVLHSAKHSHSKALLLRSIRSAIG